MSTYEPVPAGLPPPDGTLERLAFLARAGEVLASSLDFGQTLQEVARLAVSILGDMCIVDVVEDGALRRLAIAHAIPAKARYLDELRQSYPPAPGSPQPAARVLRTGEPEILENVTPEVVAAHTRNQEHARLILAIGVRSHLAVPLIARGSIVGVLSLGITDSERRYGAADLALAQDLSRRAALAVDNARLYQRAQEELTERRRAEEALRFSEARSRAIIEQSPLSMQILAPDGTTIRINRAWEGLWGVTLDRIAGYNILADPQLEALGITPLLRRAFAGEAVRLPEIRYDPEQTLPNRSRHADPVRWVRAFAYPVKDATGAVREVVLVHEDVTQARHGQERLRESEERLRLALGAGRMTVWNWDLTTDVVECDNAREFWGIDVGKSADFLRVIHPDDLPAMEQAARTAVGGEGAYLSEYRLRAPDGATRWVQSRGRVDRGPDGVPVRVLGVTIDITGLKRAEETTRLLADAGATLGGSLDYHATLQHLTHLLVPRLADWCAVDLLTEAGMLERVSVHHADSRSVALANELFTRFPPRREDPYGVWHVLESREPEWAAEISDDVLESVAHAPEHLELLRGLNLRSFICVPLIARNIPLGVLTLAYAESGRRYGVSDVDLARDLARRAAAAVDNAQLYTQMRAEDRRKDEFLATLAHELRNPLAPIRTGLSLLRVTTDPEALEKTRRVMERQLGHMVRLIDDLLDLSRVTRGRLQLEMDRLDLQSIVGTAIETSRPLLEKAGVQLDVRLPGAPVILEADGTRLSQVLSNLLNNASKFTARGGRVELDAEEEGTDVVIRVRDNGAGIPPQMLNHIFEMFVQAGDVGGMQNPGGLGIGLTLVRRLVELHGGRVWAESEGPGRGSAFIIRLPRAQENPAPPAVTSASMRASADGPSSTRRVLIVDDNTDAAQMLEALLGLDGHEVRTAHSGPEALDAIRDFHPDVAFLDIGLPGMNGYELARRLRAEPRLDGMTLVALTGWGQDEDRRRSTEAGIDHHLTKPVEPNVIRGLVAQSKP